MTAPTVVPATADDVRGVAEVVALGFQHLPVVCWLVPDVSRRIGTLSSYFAILVEHALDHGHVDRLADDSAVAVWFHNDPTPAPPPPDYQRRVQQACGDFTGRFLDLDAVLDQHHPTGVRHHHLALLSVLPDRQGRGRGTALLRHHLNRLDSAGLPAYLEASSSGSRDLYGRHGFRAGQPFGLPPGGGRFWPMWRDPRPAAP